MRNLINSVIIEGIAVSEPLYTKRKGEQHTTFQLSLNSGSKSSPLLATVYGQLRARVRVCARPAFHAGDLVRIIGHLATGSFLNIVIVCDHCEVSPHDCQSKCNSYDLKDSTIFSVSSA